MVFIDDIVIIFLRILSQSTYQIESPLDERQYLETLKYKTFDKLFTTGYTLYII